MMFRAGLSAFLLALLLPLPALAAGEDDPATAAVRESIRKLSAHPEDVVFGKITTHARKGEEVSCGEARLVPLGKKTDESVVFGVSAASGGPVLFETLPIPERLDFREVNEWLNRSVALEDLEELGCVPQGSYKRYRRHLNHVMEQRKDTSG
ncbi:hypothetical protein LOC54_00235 [Acetobacter sp. AN02]|uniref:hypothetical protein n=1 Tax=Acetobacter sp. AN02 TaxID=2894186 RepID=UPI0024342422|nr:hypothetical protein [Acetobacter sp. AN02]MDG6093552.1 hypothetical protein [Acetobacter sp. AN02]